MGKPLLVQTPTQTTGATAQRLCVRADCVQLFAGKKETESVCEGEFVQVQETVLHARLSIQNTVFNGLCIDFYTTAVSATDTCYDACFNYLTQYVCGSHISVVYIEFAGHRPHESVQH